MIKSVILENWRSHEHTEFHFRKGTNVLVGVMGSGKSSVMDAISFALFGTFPNLQARKVKLDDIIMKKPVKKNHAKVTLTFEYNGDEFTVSRKIERGRGTTEVTLRKNGSLVEVSAARVNEFLNNLLKIDYDLFSRAIYSEQNKIDYFLQIPKGQRKQKIDELLRINRYEDARKNLVTLIKRLEDRLEEKKRGLKPVDEEEIKKLEQEVHELKKQIKRNALRIKETEEIVTFKKKEFSKMEEQKRKYHELSRELERILGRIQSVEDRIKGVKIRENIEELVNLKKQELNEAMKTKEEIGKLQHQLKTKKELYEKNQRKIEELKKEFTEIDENTEIRKKKIEDEIEELNKRKIVLKSRIEALNSKINEINESLTKLVGDKCPVCGAELTSEKKETITLQKKKEIQKAEHEKNTCLAEINKIEKRINELSLEKRELEELLKNIEKNSLIKAQIKDIETENNKLSTEMSEIKKKLESIVFEEPEKIMKELEALNKELEAKHMLDELNFLKERKTFLEKEISEIHYSEEDMNKLLNEMKALEIEAGRIKAKLETLRLLLGEKEKHLNELLEMKRTYEREFKAIEKLSEYITSFKILESVLRSVQVEIRNEFTKTLNTALHDLWNNFYPYGDYISLKLGVDEDGDYILQVQENSGNWINVEGIISGGERSSACLCLRIAMALVLTQNLSWIILDEPTHNIDKNGIRELARILREHLPQIVEQIFVITHEDELENAATGSLYRLERNKEKNEPTKAIVEILEE